MAGTFASCSTSPASLTMQIDTQRNETSKAVYNFMSLSFAR
jgi:hypothetical protein